MRRLLFKDCYADLEDMAVDGLSKNVSIEKIPANTRDMIYFSGPQRAWAAITGARGFAFQQKPVQLRILHRKDETCNIAQFVLRNEHLVRDWNTIDYMFGGSGTSGNSLFGKFLNRVNAPKQILSDSALEHLCRALCRDIQHYKHMLLGAVNLDSNQKTMSMLELKEVCPQETMEIRTCVETPRFPSGPWYT